MCVYVCICVCVWCVCVCVSVEKRCVWTFLHWLPPNFIHALKICRGSFFSQFQSAKLIGRALSRRPLFVAAMASCTAAGHDHWPSTNFLRDCECEHKTTAAHAQKWPATEPVVYVTRAMHAFRAGKTDMILKKSKSAVLKYNLAAQPMHVCGTNTVRIDRKLKNKAIIST